ncbi:MAG: hypothetical protein UHH95_02630 [Oscillospiraceae bacterium]|nr:hypothetical protein [Oscillospiraceae bacterium]
MLKKILAVTLAVMTVVTFATGCKEKEKEKGNSSKKPTSSAESVYVPDENVVSSGAIAEVESNIDIIEPEDESSSNPYKWTMQTSSAFFRDTDEAKESVTVSEAIKKYKGKGTYQVGAFMLNMTYCVTAYGEDRNSRLKEFSDAVNSGYFNCYLISDGGYLEDMLPIIAESGGEFWFQFGRYNEKTTPQGYIQYVRERLAIIREYGCEDLLLGCYWDEPIWTGMRNEDLAEQMRINYQVFGMRNLPIFATGEFSNLEGNSDSLGGVTADQMRKVLRPTCKYATDIAFDDYSTDVRDAAYYSDSTIAKWAEATNNVFERKFGRKMKSGKDHYIAFKEHLLEYIGHDANFYYFPCAYSSPVTGGINASVTEAYCTAHLEWMAEDVLNDKRGGGVYLYAWRRNTGIALNQVLVLEDEYGYPLMFPDREKWETYSAALKKVCEKFSATKQTLVYQEPNK